MKFPPGKAYKVTMDLEPASQPQAAAGVGGPNVNPKVKHAKRRHLAFDLIVLGTIGAGTWGLWYELSMTPSAPSNLSVQ